MANCIYTWGSKAAFSSLSKSLVLTLSIKAFRSTYLKLPISLIWLKAGICLGEAFCSWWVPGFCLFRFSSSLAGRLGKHACCGMGTLAADLTWLRLEPSTRLFFLPQLKATGYRTQILWTLFPHFWDEQQAAISVHSFISRSSSWREAGRATLLLARLNMRLFHWVVVQDFPFAYGNFSCIRRQGSFFAPAMLLFALKAHVCSGLVAGSRDTVWRGANLRQACCRVSFLGWNNT